MRAVVVGGGITGLAAGYWLSERARAAGRPLDVRVLEAGTRAGGHVETRRQDGFVVEAGPNGWLDREPAARALLRDLGLEPHVVEARPAAKRRYVVRRGRLCRVPDAPPTLIATPALSIAGKLRLLLEPFVPPIHGDVDETVYEFARRRIGEDAAEHLVDAAISGISAGDSRRLSVRAAFPIMVEMEREHGSLIRAMLARRKGPGPTRLVSLDQGLGLVVETLVRALGERLTLGAGVQHLARCNRGWRLAMADGEEIHADHVVLALPARRAAPLVRDADPDLARDLGSIPHAGLAVVALAYRVADVTRPLDGYGHLMTRGEQSETLGVVWESTLFEGRAPEGWVLLRAMVGGARRPECAELAPDELEARARRDLEPLLGVRAAPSRRWVFRRPAAIPQYERGHLERIARLRAAVAQLGALELCGTSYDGISFASAIASADRLAERLLAAASAPSTNGSAPTSGGHVTAATLAAVGRPS